MHTSTTCGVNANVTGLAADSVVQHKGAASQASQRPRLEVVLMNDLGKGGTGERHGRGILSAF